MEDDIPRLLISSPLIDHVFQPRNDDIKKIEDKDSRLTEVGTIHSICIPGNGSERGKNSLKFSWNSSFFIEPVDWISILEKKLENSWKEVEKSSPPLPSSVDQLDGILGFSSSSPRLTLEFHLSLEDS